MNIKKLVRQYLREALENFDNHNEEIIEPTTQWMKKWFVKLNNDLFGNSLPLCKFRVANLPPITLGEFQVKPKSGEEIGSTKDKNGKIRLSVSRLNGLIVEPVTPKNFVNICNPTIKLNKYYKGDEKSMLWTLIHEMCHYYEYMYDFDGQDHGESFMRIANAVSSKTNGLISIQKIADAEEVHILKQEQFFNEKLYNRESFLIFLENDVEHPIRLFASSSEGAINKVIKLIYMQYDKVTSIRQLTKPQSLELLTKYQFLTNMKSNKYWALKSSAIDDFLNCPYTEIYNKDNNTNQNDEDNAAILSFMQGRKVYVVDCNGKNEVFISSLNNFAEKINDAYYGENYDLRVYDNDNLRIYLYNDGFTDNMRKTKYCYDLDQFPELRNELDKYSYQSN